MHTNYLRHAFALAVTAASLNAQQATPAAQPSGAVAGGAGGGGHSVSSPAISAISKSPVGLKVTPTTMGRPSASHISPMECSF